MIPGQEYEGQYLTQKETSQIYPKIQQTTNRPMKKERTIPPLLTSYTVPFHFVESGRRNQLLICEGHKYILNNKYGEKSCKYDSKIHKLFNYIDIFSQLDFKCSSWHSGCKARAITISSQPDCKYEFFFVN